MARENTPEAIVGKVHDIVSVLSSPERDFLIRNNGDQVKIDSLKGKKVGIYFSASWCGPCHCFTPILAEAYGDLRGKGDFEIVYVSEDEDNESFNEYFSTMPWLAVPFADSDTRYGLDKLFEMTAIPYLVIINGAGGVTSDDGVGHVEAYGAEAYPFTSERIKELEDKEEDARRNQTLNSILVNSSRDFVLSSDGNKVSVSQLEGKTVRILFLPSSHESCTFFNSNLLELYEKLNAKGVSFEVVLVPLDDDQASFDQSFKTMPWLSLPVGDKTCRKLDRYFEVGALPTLVIIGSDGKTLHSNFAEAVEEHGGSAYPFTPERFAELEAIAKAEADAQTLESVLVSGDLDFVIGKEGLKVPVADLVGKNILLYFSAHSCAPCHAFLPKLIDAYQEIKSKDNAFEVIFISSDEDQTSFDNFFSKMPWLAVPFGDPRKSSLSRTFKVQGIPTVAALGTTGRTITNEVRELIMNYGPDAYPFAEDHIKKLEAKFEEMVKGWAQKLKHDSHDHELVLSQRQGYICDGCEVVVLGCWSYLCDECDFDLHPKCAFGEEKAVDTKDEEAKPKAKEAPDGWVCEGDVCHRA